MRHPNPLNDIFPDAQAVFSGRGRPLQEAMGDCIVALDTSVLLLPYEIGSSSIDDIKDHLVKLRGESRLRIPAQVAREFASRRPSKLAEVYKLILQLKSNAKPVEIKRIPLLDSTERFEKARSVAREINKLIVSYQEAMTAVSQMVESWEWDDPISLIYEDLFCDPGLVVEAAVPASDLEKDAAWRSKYSVPPGFKDEGKSSNALGDLIIWKTLIEIGKSERKDVLLVTLEKKADWWTRSDDTTLYPRYELNDEFRRLTEGRSFYLASFSDFLEMMGALATTVSDVRHEEFLQSSAINLDRLVADWPTIIAIVNRDSGLGRRTAALMTEVDIVYVEPGSVYGVSPYEFHRNRLTSPECRSLIENVMAEFYGEPMSFYVLSLSEAEHMFTDAASWSPVEP